MEEIVVPHRGTVGMEGFALLLAVLVQAEIQKIFIWEDGKREITHRSGSFLIRLQADWRG